MRLFQRTEEHWWDRADRIEKSLTTKGEKHELFVKVKRLENLRRAEWEAARVAARAGQATQWDNFDYRLERHQRQFRCHICIGISADPMTSHVTVSEGPAIQRIEDNALVMLKDIEFGSNDVLILWDMPDPHGMHRCQLCHTWVCTAHAKLSICRTCAKTY